jgi:putative transposase
MRTATLRFVPIRVGSKVMCGDRMFEITGSITSNRVLGIDLESKKTESLLIDDIRPLEKQSLEESESTITAKENLLGHDQEQWSKARMRFAAIKPLVGVQYKERSDVSFLATTNGIHRSTLYRWLRTYANEGQVSALVATKPGRKTGSTVLREEQEKMITSAIEDLYLTPQRHKASDVVAEVQARCSRLGIRAPCPNTIRSRVAAIHPAHALRKRGRRDMASNRYDSIRGSFPGATHPLAVVQIDHTQVDIFVVDEIHRLAISRPWLTLAIDVYSRMVVGIHLGFDEPSAVTAGMCLANAICPKREYLAHLGVKGNWPTYGIMSAIHSDNGSEFHSQLLQRACENFAIDIHWRAIPKPNWGGHIERLMGTVANELRKLPGTTFSNPSQRKGYDSEARAALTIRELEQQIVEFFVNIYHLRVHSELGIPPIKRWELGISGDGAVKGTGNFDVPEDPQRVRIEFLPFEERTIQPYGICLNGVTYYDPILDPHVGSTDPQIPSRKQKFTIRRDPRDISKVYFLDPATHQYTPIPYRNTGLPAISLRELQATKKLLRERGENATDQAAIFSAIERNRTRVDEAQRKTKAARREVARRPKAEAAAVVSSQSKSLTITAETAPADDPFSVPIVPFDIISHNQ